MQSTVLFYTNPASPDPNPDQLTIMTYNIGYASGDKNNKGNILTQSEIIKNLDIIVRTIQEHNPDIIGLQEADFNASRSHYLNQLEYIATRAGLPYAATAITWDKRYIPWPYWPPQNHFGKTQSGQAILSRYPILSQKLTTLPKPDQNPFWYNWFYLERIVQDVMIDLPSGKLQFFHVHLEAFQAQNRNKQAHILSSLLSESTNPRIILAGDFNSVSKRRNELTQSEQMDLEDNGEALQIILDQTSLKNAEMPETGLTIPSWAPFKKIDHILYSNNLELLSSITPQGIAASDHLPVIATFTLTAK